MTLAIYSTWSEVTHSEYSERFCSNSTPSIPIVGWNTWMDPDTKAMDFKIVSTELYRGTRDVVLAEVSRIGSELETEKVESAFFAYLLNGECYSLRVALGFDSGDEVEPPAIGPYYEYFPEREAFGCNKRVTQVEKLCGPQGKILYLCDLVQVEELAQVAA